MFIAFFFLLVSVFSLCCIKKCSIPWRVKAWKILISYLCIHDFGPSSLCCLSSLQFLILCSFHSCSQREDLTDKSYSTTTRRLFLNIYSFCLLILILNAIYLSKTLSSITWIISPIWSFFFVSSLLYFYLIIHSPQF